MVNADNLQKYEEFKLRIKQKLSKPEPKKRNYVDLERALYLLCVGLLIAYFTASFALEYYMWNK